MRLRFSPHIKHDLAEIAEYIARDSPRYAANWVRLLRSHFTKIAQNSTLYQLRPELAPDARLAAVGNYVIRIRQDTVRIERVVQGTRELPPLLVADP